MEEVKEEERLTLTDIHMMEHLKLFERTLTLGATEKSNWRPPIQPGVVIGFLGEPGSGKSLAMVHFARHFQKSFPGLSLFSDFEMEGKNVFQIEFEGLLDLFMHEPKRLTNSIVLVDEIKRWIARSGTLALELFTRWMEMRRKINMNIFWATQFDIGLPTELFLHTNFTIHPLNPFGWHPSYLNLVIIKRKQGVPISSAKRRLWLKESDFQGYDTAKIFNPTERFKVGAGQIRAMAKRGGIKPTEEDADIGGMDEV